MGYYLLRINGSSALLLLRSPAVPQRTRQRAFHLHSTTLHAHGDIETEFLLLVQCRGRCRMLLCFLMCLYYASYVSCVKEARIPRSLRQPLPTKLLQCGGSFEQSLLAQPFQSIPHLFIHVLFHFAHSTCKLLRGFPQRALAELC